jgi:AraC-like DNA-binding protein
MPDPFSIQVRFYRLSEELQPYFTALYQFTIECEDGARVRDCLHPEWTMLRFCASGDVPRGRVGPGDLHPTWPYVASGPTTQSTRFTLGRSTLWGLGLQPVGFAKYLNGTANEVADRIVDGRDHEVFGSFAPILDIVRQEVDDCDGAAEKIDRFLLNLPRRDVPQESAIRACQEAHRDSAIARVEELAERVGVSQRSLERLCARYFGFPPKTLLRRQRFLRSLAHFALNPRGSWARALDGQYTDQAHFVRDFRAFMGMTPSEYADMPHPFLDRIMAQRMADVGAAPQTDLPTVLRYSRASSEQARGKGPE